MPVDFRVGNPDLPAAGTFHRDRLCIFNNLHLHTQFFTTTVFSVASALPPLPKIPTRASSVDYALRPEGGGGHVVRTGRIPNTLHREELEAKCVGLIGALFEFETVNCCLP
jgi:hypothetical protein